MHQHSFWKNKKRKSISVSILAQPRSLFNCGPARFFFFSQFISFWADHLCRPIRPQTRAPRPPPRAQAATWAWAGKVAWRARPPGPILARCTGGRRICSPLIERPDAAIGETKTRCRPTVTQTLEHFSFFLLSLLSKRAAAAVILGHQWRKKTAPPQAPSPARVLARG
jgi:hypothetical protein